MDKKMNKLSEIKEMLNEDEDLELSQSEEEVETDEEEISECTSKREEELKQQGIEVSNLYNLYNLYNPVSKSVYSKADNTYKFSLENQDIQIKSKLGICFKCSCLDKILLIQKDGNSMVQICEDCLSKFI